MAPTLTSNSFFFTTPPPSRLLTQKNPKLSVSTEAFRFGKQDNGTESSSEEEGSTKSNKLSFDFTKIPNVNSLIPVVSKPASGLSLGQQRRKDAGTVFIAGATGQAGVRIVQTLLREGFSVRAGVPDLGAAQELARVAAQYKIISPKESKRLIAVESTFQDVKSIAKTIGNASKVVVTIGPTEDGPTSAVTTSNALKVIEAAQLASVSHVAIIYDDKSISSSSLTYNNVFNGISSFFNNLFSKSQPVTIKEFIHELIQTDVRYTLVKTSLTEDFAPESSYNVVVSAEGSPSANDYKVSKSQIASLVAAVLSNTAVAENKVVEVSTDPSAPLKAVEQLFSSIPEDGRRQAYAEAMARAKAEEEAQNASEKAREASVAAKMLEEVKKLSEQEAQAASLAEEAQKKAEAAGTSLENLMSKSKDIISAESLLNKAKDISTGWSWEKLSSQIATAVPKPDENPKVQIATVRGQAKARTLPPKKAVVKPTPKAPSSLPKKSKTEQNESKKEVKNVFGGLFKQETIYIDETVILSSLWNFVLKQ